MAEAPEAAAPGPGPVDQGSAEQLAESVQSGLMQLNQLFGAAPSIAPEERGELAEITERFQGLIQALMQGPPAPMPGEGVAAPEAGAAKVKPAM